MNSKLNSCTANITHEQQTHSWTANTTHEQQTKLMNSEHNQRTAQSWFFLVGKWIKIGQKLFPPVHSLWATHKYNELYKKGWRGWGGGRVGGVNNRLRQLFVSIYLGLNSWARLSEAGEWNSEPLIRDLSLTLHPGRLLKGVIGVNTILFAFQKC